MNRGEFDRRDEFSRAPDETAARTPSEQSRSNRPSLDGREPSVRSRVAIAVQFAPERVAEVTHDE